MIEVTKNEFFAVIGKRDVMPRVDQSTLKGRHHTSDWETPRRDRIGKSVSDSYGSEPSRFYLRADLA